jgi:hypothetical protein
MEVRTLRSGSKRQTARISSGNSRTFVTQYDEPLTVLTVRSDFTCVLSEVRMPVSAVDAAPCRSYRWLKLQGIECCANAC